MDNGLMITPIGTLKILDLFFYYDGPRIFTCINKTGNQFLGYLVDELEDFHQWFFVPINRKKIEMLKNGEISIKEVIKNPEDGWVWWMSLPVNEGIQQSAEILYSQDISEDDLPSDDSFLVFNSKQEDYNSKLPTRRTQPSVESIESARDVLDLSLKVAGIYKNEVNCDFLSSVLLSIQSLVYSLDPNWGGKKKGKIPKSVIENSTMNVTELFAASFGIRLKSTDSADLFGDTKSALALKHLIDLIESSQDIETLMVKMENLSSRTILWYRRLLENLDENRASINAEWASPKQEHKISNLNSYQINKALQMLYEVGEDIMDEYEITGTLLGINVRRNTFSMESYTGEYFYGVLSEEFKEHVFEVPMKATALIEANIQINPNTKKETITYILKSIEPLENIEETVETTKE